MKPQLLLKCVTVLAAILFVARTDAAPPPIGPEYRVGGFVLGCQAYTFHRFTAFEAIDKTAAAAGKAIEFYPGQALSPDHFGPRGDKPAVKFTWYEGGLKPPRPDGMEGTEQFDGNGILFIGDKGTLSSPGWGGRPKLLPASRDKTYQRPAQSLPRSKGHHREWLDACKGGPSPSSDFQYGAALTEVGLLGLVAMRVGKRISWDAKAIKCANAPEADKYLKEAYRAGWEIPT